MANTPAGDPIDLVSRSLERHEVKMPERRPKALWVRPGTWGREEMMRL